jgi:uncharacterized protein involved in exopolysaccharide biosynthesis/Mrp family chromosome partitioning ATPase
MSMTATGVPAAVYDGDLDVRRLGQALWRRKLWIIVPTILAAAIATVGVNVVTPKYKSEARILYDGRENIFLRPDVDKANLDRSLDQEALASQVQLLLSRQLARDVIVKLKLNEQPEFDPVLRGISPLSLLLVSAGIARDPMRMTPDERVLEAFSQRLAVYPIEKSRVMVVEFQSTDPELAARVANAVAESYLTLQQAAKQEQTRAAGQWLSGEIDRLRVKVQESEAKVESFRARTNLLVGPNNTTLSKQQLGELNSQLGAAQGQKSDAETRARMIRDMLRRGTTIDASDLINSELIRRLSEQRVALRAQLAEQSSTLLDAHPRIKELKAQIADYDKQIRSEAEKTIRMLETDARIAEGRVESLTTSLDALKRQAASSNEEDVQLRALEREAKAQRELLESYLAKYRETIARDTIGSAPPDARVISNAEVSNIPYFPKKLPIVVIAALATLMTSLGLLTTGELLRAQPVPFADIVAATPAGARLDAPTHPALGVQFSAIDDLARLLQEAETGGGHIAVFGASPSVGTSLAAMTLARTLARTAKIVLIDLASGVPASAVISTDPDAPGLADVVRGTASYGSIITRDRVSRLHLVSLGEVGDDEAAIFASPRFGMSLEALASVYDHVVIDAGAVSATTMERLVRFVPRAALVASQEQALDTRTGREQLTAAGYCDVAVLDGAPIVVADDAETVAA